jgi:hypothetical protein
MLGDGGVFAAKKEGRREEKEGWTRREVWEINFNFLVLYLAGMRHPCCVYEGAEEVNVVPCG